MKKVKSIIIVATLITSIVAASDFDQNVYSQYRIKELSYTVPQFKIDGYLDQDNDFFDEYVGDTLDYHRIEKYFRLSTTSLLHHYFESEDRVISTGLRIYRYRRNSDFHYDSYRISDRGSHLVRTDIDFNFTGRFYPFSSNLFLRSSLDSYRHVNRDESTQEVLELTSEVPSSERTTGLAVEQDVELGLGIGFGRVRNVTSVHQAILIFNKLHKIFPEMPETSLEALIATAQTVQSRKYFLANHYRYNKYFWESLSLVLDSLGYEVSEMDPESVFFVNESMSEIHYSRYIGCRWDVNVHVNYNKLANEHMDYGNQDTLLNSESEWREDSYIAINPQFEWFLPTSLKSQYHFTAGLLAGPTLQTDRIYSQKYIFESSLGYKYDISDRLSFANTIAYRYQQRNGDTMTFDSSWSFNPVFKYYLIDYAYISLDYKFSHLKDNVLQEDPPKYRRFRDNRILLTLTLGPSSPSVATSL